MKKILWILLAACLLLSACAARAEEPEREDGRLKIVTTVFPAYDFARAAAGEWADVELLLPPGAESHSYEPTPADILAVQGCDLFVYLGGESDAWVDTILGAVEPQGRQLRMIDCVPLLEEETVEGMQPERGHSHDHEEDHGHEDGHDDHEAHHGEGEVTGLDEHVWTSPANAAAITRAIGRQLAELDSARSAGYTAAAEAYAAQLDGLDQEFAAFFAQHSHSVMVFGDRFPLRYFAAAYGVEYYAAFPGCGTQTEPSAATVAFLTEKVRTEQLPVVWYIEFSNHLVADSIAEAAGAKTAMFHTCHNVSRRDMENGATYLSLMEGNLETLRQYLT